jgi:chromatin segregation and condensation protein Rec8/ScpA/Scc1 (kleisin family)
MTTLDDEILNELEEIKQPTEVPTKTLSVGCNTVGGRRVRKNRRKNKKTTKTPHTTPEMMSTVPPPEQDTEKPTLAELRLAMRARKNAVKVSRSKKIVRKNTQEKLQKNMIAEITRDMPEEQRKAFIENIAKINGDIRVSS